MARSTPIFLRLFNAYNIASTGYVYDDAGGQAPESGKIDVRELKHKVVEVNITKDVATTSIEIIIEGKIHREAAWAQIYTKSYSASLGQPELITISEYPLVELRFGCKITGSTGSANAVTAYIAAENEY